MKSDLGKVRVRDAASPPFYGAELFRAGIVATALVAVGLALYRDFVFGDKTLLYKDTGSDSINISYPLYVLLSDYLRQVGIPSWSFRVGMGQSLFPNLGAVLLSPVVWLAKGAIARALAYQHLLYIAISGVVFARFLAGHGAKLASCLLGALLLSFSAYMCMGSCWTFHANEIVCFTFLLFAAEHAIGRGRWLYLVLAVAIVGLLGAFHLYLCALLLSFYVPLRLIDRYSWQPQRIARTCCLLGAAAVLGLGLGAIAGMDNLFALLNSPRGSGTVANSWGTPTLFELGSPLHYITAALRPFSNDIIGTGNDFRGWQNYLEAPPSYCGLLALLLLPQVFIGAARRQRILYAVFLSCILLPVVLPWFRHLFWLFHGGYYRALSLFSIFGVITLSVTAFSRYTEGRILSFWTLGATLVGLLAILYLPIGEMAALINPKLRQMVTILLIVYTLLLVVGRIIKHPRIAAWAIVGVTVIELIYFDRITINRPTITKQELDERVGYNDETVDAVRDIKVSDNGFFRITKTFGSGLAIYPSLNDAMVFGYYGTTSYSSFNNLNYIKFLMAVDAISGSDLATDTQWSKGLLGYPLLSIFACEKYVITNDPVPYQMITPYEFTKRYNEVYVFRNRHFVPLGLTFSRYVTEDVFLNLPSGVKAGALLQAVVLEDRKIARQHGLSELTFDQLKQQLNTSTPAETIDLLRSGALDIQSFRETKIDGVIRVNAKSILVVQTPFDPGWRALVDNQPAPVIKVDAGLLGVVLSSPGEHAVQLRYIPPYLVTGASITLASLAILAVFLWKWPRMTLPA
jgi:hypothetical protein